MMALTIEALPLLVVTPRTNEGDVHLQLVHFKLLQIGQRAIAGAEIADRQTHPERAQIGQSFEGWIAVHQHAALGNLGFQLLGPDAGFREGGLDRIDKPAAAQLDGGNAHRRVARRQPGLRPLLDLPASLAQHPIAKAHYQAALLGEGNELARRAHAPLGVSPPNQRFEADNLSIDQVDLRLIVEEQLIALQCRAQLGIKRQTLFRPSGRFRREKTHAAFSLCLGLMERRVGAASQRFYIAAVRGVKRDADTGADIDICGITVSQWMRCVASSPFMSGIDQSISTRS